MKIENDLMKILDRTSIIINKVHIGVEVTAKAIIEKEIKKKWWQRSKPSPSHQDMTNIQVLMLIADLQLQIESL